MNPRVYLDHASASPLLPAAFDAMLPWLRDHYADPGRLHREALEVRAAIEDARVAVATFVGATPREIVFTASGTEAINTALWWTDRHVVTTAVEHAAAREVFDRGNADTTVIGVDRNGKVDPQAVVDAVRPDTQLVNVQLANHEVGTLQPVREICAALKEHRARVHVDACAAFGNIPIDFHDLGADLMSITGHKVGGPPGCAALVVRRGVRIPTLLVGGAQERARRAGIENTAAIVGFAAACSSIDLDKRAASARELVAQAWREIGAIEGVHRLGPDGRSHAALPHLLCIAVDGVEAEPILLALDQRGVAIHSGSACSSESWEPSPVLAAMGVDAQHSLRMSVGWPTTASDISRFADAFADAVNQLRMLRS